MSKTKAKPSGAFKAGAVCLAFLILGYQIAVFIHKAAVERIVSLRERPDTVFVVDSRLAEELLSGSSGQAPANSGSGSSGQASESAGSVHSGPVVIKKRSPRSDAALAIAEKHVPRKTENFRFNPNTVSVEELMRLGFSEKQAQSIDNYRKKGGRFRRKSDFAKSYVVSDSVFKRLEPYIDIPKIDINKADSAAFDSLPGIGAWFSSQMLEYRKRLRGYSCTEQLMEIHNFDRQRYDALKDLISCSDVEAYPFWSAPADSLRLHPHVASWQCAKAIVFYREHNPRDKWTIDGLLAAGILSESQAAGLRLCKLE